MIDNLVNSSLKRRPCTDFFGNLKCLLNYILQPKDRIYIFPGNLFRTLLILFVLATIYCVMHSFNIGPRNPTILNHNFIKNAFIQNVKVNSEINNVLCKKCI